MVRILEINAQNPLWIQGVEFAHYDKNLIFDSGERGESGALVNNLITHHAVKSYQNIKECRTFSLIQNLCMIC